MQATVDITNPDGNRLDSKHFKKCVYLQAGILADNLGYTRLSFKLELRCRYDLVPSPSALSCDPSVSEKNDST